MKAWMQPVLDWATAYYGNKWYLLFALIAYVYLFLQPKRADGNLDIHVYLLRFWY